jgi:hypothetical protein
VQKNKEQDLLDVVRFADEDDKEKDQKQDQVGAEIRDFLMNADRLITVLDKIVPGIQSDAVVNKEAFVKIVKPLAIAIENLLPRLREYQDNLEYLKDENADVLRQKIVHIEDDLLPEILLYLKNNEVTAKK